MMEGWKKFEKPLKTITRPKRALLDLECNATVEQALHTTFMQNILSVPVWSKPGGWIGAGNSEFVVHQKQVSGRSSKKEEGKTIYIPHHN